MPKLEAKQPEITKDNTTKQTDLFIKKIKYNLKEKQLEIHYTKFVGTYESKETVYKSQEEPQADWFTPFYALQEELFKILDLPEEYGDNVEMKGISISDSGGATITAVKKFPDFDDKAFCINSPHLPMYADDKGSATLPRTTVWLIEQLQEETKLYICGKIRNTQLKLV